MNIIERVNNTIIDYYAKCVLIPKFLILDNATYKFFSKALNVQEGQPPNKRVTRYKGMKVCVLKEDAYNYIRCI